MSYNELTDKEISEQFKRIQTLEARCEWEEIQKVEPPNYFTMMQLGIHTWKIDIKKINPTSWLDMSKEAREISQILGLGNTPGLDVGFVQLAKVGLLLCQQPEITESCKQDIVAELSLMSKLMEKDRNFEGMMPNTELLRNELAELFASDNSEKRTENVLKTREILLPFAKGQKQAQ